MSSSFSRKSLQCLYEEIRNRGGAQRSGCSLMQDPHRTLGFAAGLAVTASMQRERTRVYCSMSDNDQFLGGVWEAAIRAVKLQLWNLLAFVVDSGRGPGLVADKYAACGWNVLFMDAADIQEGYNMLSAHDLRGVPSVIITQAAARNAEAKTASFELMEGISRGIAEIPGAAEKALFLVTSPRFSGRFSERYEKAGDVILVDCGTARTTALALAMGFREAGGIPFLAHRGERSFALCSCFRGGSDSAEKHRVEYPRSALEAKAAVLRLWNLKVPWQIRIKCD